MIPCWESKGNILIMLIPRDKYLTKHRNDMAKNECVGWMTCTQYYTRALEIGKACVVIQW